MGTTRLASQPTNWSAVPRLHWSRARSCSPARNRRQSPACAHPAIAPGRLRRMARDCGNTSGAGACRLLSTKPRRQPLPTGKKWRPAANWRAAILCARPERAPLLRFANSSPQSTLVRLPSHSRFATVHQGVLTGISLLRALAPVASSVCCADRLRLLLPDRRRHAQLTLPVKRSLSGDHLIQHRAQRKDVTPAIQFFPFHLLRRHVLERPDNGALFGGGRLLHGCRRQRSRAYQRRSRLGEPEVQ